MTQFTQDVTPEQTPRQKSVHSGQNGYEHYRRTFIRLFGETARYHHRYEVFRDFVAMGRWRYRTFFCVPLHWKKSTWLSPGDIRLTI